MLKVRATLALALRRLVKVSLCAENNLLKPIQQLLILAMEFTGSQLQAAGLLQALMLPFTANELMVATVI